MRFLNRGNCNLIESRSTDTNKKSGYQTLVGKLATMFAFIARKPFSVDEFSTVYRTVDYEFSIMELSIMKSFECFALERLKYRLEFSKVSLSDRKFRISNGFDTLFHIAFSDSSWQ